MVQLGCSGDAMPRGMETFRLHTAQWMLRHCVPGEFLQERVQLFFVVTEHGCLQDRGDGQSDRVPAKIVA